MTKEEAKDFLFDMSNLIGTTAMEHWTEKDAEKMRQAVLTIENESAQPDIKEMAVDKDYLRDWYQSSVLDDEWPDRYIEEVYHDFYLIPKQEEKDGKDDKDRNVNE